MPRGWIRFHDETSVEDARRVDDFLSSQATGMEPLLERQHSA
jgi:hypothetical protein